MWGITFFLGLLCLLGSNQCPSPVFTDAWPDWPNWTNVTSKWNLEWLHHNTSDEYKDTTNLESKRRMMKKSVEEVMTLYKAKLKEFKNKVDGRIKVFNSPLPILCTL